MCIAIAKPAGVKIPVEFLRESYVSNPHGAGFSFESKGKICTIKGVYPSFEDFFKDYSEFATDQRAVIIHFRWATAGEQTAENCHPFVLSRSRAAMIHNGTLPSPYGKFRGGASDTADFTARVLDPVVTILQESHFKVNHRPFLELVSLAIGDGNKMAFLDHTGAIGIANQHLGHWRGGAWYSNYDYLPIIKTGAKKKNAKKKKKKKIDA